MLRFSKLPKDIQELIAPEGADAKFGDPVVIGVDEVGRGCLAGPVVAGACVLKLEHFKKYKDSKTQSAKQREILSAEIKEKHVVHLGEATVDEIDEHNILNATFIAMNRAIEKLVSEIQCSDILVLVDGSMKIRRLENVRGLETVLQVPVVKGDSRVPVIAAASIVAKVYRDQLMTELSEAYAEYEFHSHKGYATSVHRQAIADFGPTKHHRKTFGGVKEWLR